MSTTLRGCAERNFRSWRIKVKVILGVQRSYSHTFVSAPYLLYSLKDFNVIWHKCLPHWGDVQSATFGHVWWRSRSFLEVKGHIVKCPSVTLSCPLHIFYTLKDFNVIWHKCLPHWGDVQSATFGHVWWRSRSFLEVKGHIFTLSCPLQCHLA